MSCRRTASRYNDRSRVDCLSPATVQHDTSGAGKCFSQSFGILLIQLNRVLIFSCYKVHSLPG
jgi:hypothetical protein